MHLLRLLGELRTKRRIFNIMYGFVKTGFRVIHRHSRPARAQVGVVVHPEKQIKYAIFFGYCGKISAHYSTSSPWNVLIITDDSQNTKKKCNIFTKLRPTVIPMALWRKIAADLQTGSRLLLPSFISFLPI